MRHAALTSFLFVALSYAASAQFRITPKLGFEQFLTEVEFDDENDIDDFDAYDSEESLSFPQFALRADYKFKGFHGPFLGIATSRSIVTYSFANPATGMTDYTTKHGDMQLRFETGYQFSFKPIYFNKSKSVDKSSYTNSATTVKSRCGMYKSSYQCGSKSKYKKDNRMNMRIEPMAGFAFITNPKTAVSSGIENGVPVTKYNAGNWNTGLITGVDFEFGKGSRSIFVVGFQYLKGLGNLGTEAITTSTANKTTTTYLQSETSSWNVTLGFPITFGKHNSAKQVAAKQKEVEKYQEPKKSYEYKYRGPCSGRYKSKYQ